MGASKRESELMIYTYHSFPMSEETHEDMLRYSLGYVRDWDCKPDDYDTLFKGDEEYSKLSKKTREARKSQALYMENKRKLKQK